MAVASVTFNGTRLNDSDASTGWGNYNIGGGTPASERANAYQISSGSSASVGVVGKKINSTAGREGVDYNGTAVDYTAAANRLLFLKTYVTDAFDLTTTWGLEFSIGSADTSNYHQYNIAGSGANLGVYSSYPAQGGYLITAIDPTIDNWAENIDVGGAFDQTAVTWYAIGAEFQNGFAKAENVSLDAIDYGTGLTITGGDGADPDGDFTFFVAEDQDIQSNRWGVVTGLGDSVVARGMLTIGSSGAATVFTDTTSIVTFADGYHSAGLFGTTVDISNASSVIQIDSTIIGNGTRNGSATLDTRPDFIVTGTSGTFSSAANIRNHRNITYTSVCDIDGADIEAELITQNACDISNSTIRTNALSGIACIQSPTFGSTTGINNCSFVQSGVGHAVEIDTVGSYTFNNLSFQGYGADATNSAAVYVSATTGTVDINIQGGGGTPTVRTAGATVNVANTVNVAVEALDLSTGNPVQGARVRLVADSGGDLAAGTVIVSDLTDVNGLAENGGFNYTNPQPVTGIVRKSSSAPYYVEGRILGTITSAGFSATIPLASDE